MKTLKFVIIVILYCHSQNAFAQRDTSYALSNLKVEYDVLKVEYDKLFEDDAILQQVIKDEANLIEEMKGKNTELNELIDKQKEEITKLKEELAKCKSKKKN